MNCVDFFKFVPIIWISGIGHGTRLVNPPVGSFMTSSSRRPVTFIHPVRCIPRFGRAQAEIHPNLMYQVLANYSGTLPFARLAMAVGYVRRI